MNSFIVSGDADPLQSEEANFDITRSGWPMLVDSRGYSYLVNKKSKVSDTVYWLCRFHKRAKCNGRATTVGKMITCFKFEHSHDPAVTLEQIYEKFPRKDAIPK